MSKFLCHLIVFVAAASAGCSSPVIRSTNDNQQTQKFNCSEMADAYGDANKYTIGCSVALSDNPGMIREHVESRAAALCGSRRQYMVIEYHESIGVSGNNDEDKFRNIEAKIQCKLTAR